MAKEKRVIASEDRRNTAGDKKIIKKTDFEFNNEKTFINVSRNIDRIM